MTDEMVSRAEATDELAGRFQARINGLALQHLAAGNKPTIPAEIAGELARLAVDWAVEHGLRLD